MSDYYTRGEFVVRSTFDGVVVERADPVVLATNELIDEWRAGTPHVHLDGDVATFGTDGLGLGRVSYRLGGRYDAHTYVLIREVRL